MEFKMDNYNTYWVVCREIPNEFFSNTIDDILFVGLYSTKELAVAACEKENDFIGPLILDAPPDYSDTVWEDAYFPLAKETE